MTIDDASETGFHRPAAILGGAILLLVGATMLLDQSLQSRLGELTAPLALIMLGTTMVFGRGGVARGRRVTQLDGTTYRLRRVRRSSKAGLWLIGIGAWMLVSQSHMFGLSFDTSWPLLVILGGILIVVRGLD